MTKLLEKAVEAARTLPPAMQDDIARIMLELSGRSEEVAALSLHDEAAVLRSREAASRGEFATEAEIQKLWAKHGL